MSLSYDLFSSMEAVVQKEPKTVSSAIETFETYFKTFSVKAEEVSGRLYAMIKKLTSEGPVNTEIKYLKVKLLDNPSALVTRITERILEQVLFYPDLGNNEQANYILQVYEHKEMTGLRNIAC